MEEEFSVVIPVYKCETTIGELCDRLTVVFNQMDVSIEILLIDDGCPHDSWEVIRKICVRNSNVKAIRFSRNFGQHLAICAGLHKSKGKWVIIMDADLQDCPEEIPKLYEKALDGFEIVRAKSSDRQDSFFSAKNSSCVMV